MWYVRNTVNEPADGEGLNEKVPVTSAPGTAVDVQL
jgi:hypothetical protein